jgi:NAD(P)-dependent dehydrogenase (short-subunit alcohol dehydrogenase family)
LYATVKRNKGRIDILFANAGIGEFAPLGRITETHYDKTFGVNVKGCSQYKKFFFVLNKKRFPFFRTAVRSF